jgi:hypothetical protein
MPVKPFGKCTGVAGAADGRCGKVVGPCGKACGTTGTGGGRAGKASDFNGKAVGSPKKPLKWEKMGFLEIQALEVGQKVTLHERLAMARQASLKIAQPFMAGNIAIPIPKSRLGRQTVSFVPDGTMKTPEP